MRYGITVLGDRVAPRSTCADTLLVVVLRHHRPRTESATALASPSLLELVKALSDHRIDTLVCGGISREEREYLAARRVEVIDNVAASVDELLAAFADGSLQPGFGLNSPSRVLPGSPAVSAHQVRVPVARSDGRSELLESADCLACRDRVCLNGEACAIAPQTKYARTATSDTARIMEAALDISFESERTLCRLSELIYFCLDMHYERIGLAYCVDLEEPAEILTRVLRRFFTVYPVCCKVGGIAYSDAPVSAVGNPARTYTHHVACNPIAQADILNRIGTDLNVLVGLGMGADCLFNRASDAPVTTLFVKDKSLANNPIGAVYSDYYIKEAIAAAPSSYNKDVPR